MALGSYATGVRVRKDHRMLTKDSSGLRFFLNINLLGFLGDSILHIGVDSLTRINDDAPCNSDEPKGRQVKFSTFSKAALTHCSD